MSAEIFLKGRVQLCCGDSLHFLRDQPDGRYDSVVTDPPYGLEFMGVAWDTFSDRPKGKPRTRNEWNDFGSREHPRKASEQARIYRNKNLAFGQFSLQWATEVFRVLKPGGHIVAFGGTRTYHRLACAIEDAGFEIRDQLQWIYGSGFPKSHNVGKALDWRTDEEISAGVEQPAESEQWAPWGTALKPACEPICLARKPLIGTVAANVLQHGTGAINIDACRVDAAGVELGRLNHVTGGFIDSHNGSRKSHARTILVDNSGDKGRWPANIIHDGSDEVIAAFPETESGLLATHHSRGSKTESVYGKFANNDQDRDFGGDSGSAARFFYTAKADSMDRLGSRHPTVKPVDLMQWLVRLVTPKGGLVLDPFAGTGTTAEACYREGMRCMLVERETEYQSDIRRRMALILSGPDERSRESIKAKLNGKPIDHGPLFSQSL